MNVPIGAVGSCVSYHERLDWGDFLRGNEGGNQDSDSWGLGTAVNVSISSSGFIGLLM